MKRKKARTVAALPEAEIYDAEILCWPWQRLVERCARIIAKIAPRESVVIDYMCGTGTMLCKVHELRPDLTLYGCDLSKSYVAHAKKKCPHVNYIIGDATRWEPPQNASVIAATAGVHHLEWSLQEKFIRKVHGELAPRGHFVLGEETIPRSGNKRAREAAVVEFFTAMLPEILRHRPVPSVISASLEVFANDLLVRGEFKRDIESMKEMLARRFTIKETIRIWPKVETGFGDYIVVAQRR